MYGSELDILTSGPFLAILFLILAGSITVAVLYLLNLQNLLKQISPENRSVEPGNVWLMFIPIFNLIYPFILYPKISESTYNEYSDRGLDTTGDFGKSIGLVMAICGVLGFLPFIGTLAGLAQFVLFIVFWVKTAGYKNELKNTPKSKGGFSNSIDTLD